MRFAYHWHTPGIQQVSIASKPSHRINLWILSLFFFFLVLFKYLHLILWITYWFLHQIFMCPALSRAWDAVMNNKPPTCSAASRVFVAQQRLFPGWEERCQEPGGARKRSYGNHREPGFPQSASLRGSELAFTPPLTRCPKVKVRMTFFLTLAQIQGQSCQKNCCLKTKKKNKTITITK